MKNLFLIISALFLICICGKANATSQAQLYALSDDFLNQRISWTEFKVALSEYKRKSSFDEESLQVLTSLLKKVQVPNTDQKELQCYQIVLTQSENSILNCDLLQIQVSELIQQIPPNEDLFIEGLNLKTLKNLKVFLPKGFIQILIRKKVGPDQIRFVDSAHLDWKHIMYNPVFLGGNESLSQVQHRNGLGPPAFYQQKTFWILTAAVLGLAFFKDKELVIEK